MGLTYALKDAWVFRAQFLGVKEVRYSLLVISFSKLTQFHLRRSSQVIRLCVGRLYLSSLIEVLNCLSMVLYVLVNNTSTLIHQPIISN